MKILLVNPSMRNLYLHTKIKAGIPEYPPLPLVTIAAPPINAGHDVKIIDLFVDNYSEKKFKNLITNFSPDMVGITFTTPLFNQMKDISNICKSMDKNIFTYAGGSHCSADPRGTLENSSLDAVVVGEGDYTTLDIINNKKLSNVSGIFFKHNNKIISTGPRDKIKNIDELQYPAWDLVDIKKYKSPRNYSRHPHPGPMESSRGCPFDCVYCNKNIFGREFRTKTPKRVVDEMEHLISLGFDEVHILDDAFSTNMDRAKKICEIITKRKLDINWILPNGIRVDCVDKELLEKLKKSGCYRIVFGVESGSQLIINRIRKGITLEQAKNATKLAKEIGFETMIYFMLALPGETEVTMQKTIDFAKNLDPDFVKFNITTPLPGTPLYDEWKNKGYITADKWSKFNFHQTHQIYQHPNLDWETIKKYYKRAYREFYFRPSYIFRRFKKSLRTGMILNDVKTFLTIKW